MVRWEAGPSPRQPPTQTYLSTSFSLALGCCCVPDSSVCRRPTLFMAEESGDAETPFWMYFLPVSGVETLRAEA